MHGPLHLHCGSSSSIMIRLWRCPWHHNIGCWEQVIVISYYPLLLSSHVIPSCYHLDLVFSSHVIIPFYHLVLTSYEGCPRNKQKKFFSSNWNKPKLNLFRFILGLFRENNKLFFRFVSVRFGVSDPYRNNQNKQICFETNRNNEKMM
jgi:hypothetical protein